MLLGVVTALQRLLAHHLTASVVTVVVVTAAEVVEVVINMKFRIKKFTSFYFNETGEEKYQLESKSRFGWKYLGNFISLEAAVTQMKQIAKPNIHYYEVIIDESAQEVEVIHV